MQGVLEPLAGSVEALRPRDLFNFSDLPALHVDFTQAGLDKISQHIATILERGIRV